MKLTLAKEIRPNDNLILVMGPIGAGKSQFIESALQDPAIHIAKEGSQSHTRAVTTYRISNRPGKEVDDDTIVLVDTPGFNFTRGNGQKTLAEIANWLQQQPQSNIILAGILWFHPINDSRMNRTTIDSFNMFIELCGIEAASSVVFITTMWDRPTQGQSAEANLNQLQGEYWKEMLQNGAKVARFDKRDDVNSAWEIIAPLAFQHATRRMLRLQEELFRHQDLAQTRAFRALETIQSQTPVIIRQLPVEKIRANDNVILVMGPTGSGKSQFIQSALQDPALKSAKERWQPQTQAIVPYRLSKGPGKDNHDDSVVLVDTPGFDDTYRDDQKTLALIGKWLKQQHQSKFLLAGVLWFHRINDSRMNKTTIDNFNMFVELCGTEAASSVVFVTTMWDLPTQGQSAEANLKQLQGEYWKEMIDNGAKVGRFDKRDDVNSAWSIITPLVSQQKTRKVLRLQAELARSPDIVRTSAFRTLLDDFERLTQDYRTKNEELQSLAHRYKHHSKHPELLKVQQEVAVLRADLDKKILETKKQKIFRRKLFGLIKSAEEKRFEQLGQCL